MRWEYLHILSPSPGTNVASDLWDTTQCGEKNPGGQSTNAAAPQMSHLELLRDLMGRTRGSQEAAGTHFGNFIHTGFNNWLKMIFYIYQNVVYSTLTC